MIKNIIDRVERGIRNEEFTGITSVAVTLALGGILVGLVAVLTYIASILHPDPRIVAAADEASLYFYISGLPIMYTLSLVIVIGLDSIIYRVVKFMTDGDHRPEYFVLKKIYPSRFFTNDIENDVLVLWFMFTAPISLGSFFTVVTLAMPFTIVIYFTIAILAGMMFLGRFMYRLSKKLKNHVQNINAHKENVNG